MLKNNDIVALYRNGIMGATSRSLRLDAAYTLTKFKGEVNRLYQEWMNKFNSLPKEAEIDDADAFQKRYTELNDKLAGGKLTAKEKTEHEAMAEKMKRLVGLQNELANDDVFIKVKPMSFEQWLILKDSNREIKINEYELFELVESSLENVIWKAPEE